MQSEILHAIGKFKLLESGKVTRGRRKNKKDWEPGTRPLTMADVKAIAGLAADRLSVVLSAYMATGPAIVPLPPAPSQATVNVVLEPVEFRHCPAEDCTDCRKPTRYWLPDGHTPLCPCCCDKRNKSVAVKIV
jgi:hypothetical protein